MGRMYLNFIILSQSCLEREFKMVLLLITPAQVPLSAEENDLIQKSSKKIKNGEGNNYNEGWPKLGTEAKKQWGLGLTFAEKLQGLNQDKKMEEIVVDENDQSDDTLLDKEDSKPLCEISEDSTRNFPTFSFSGKLKKRL
ncbi:hypothetical protein K1719_024385 [Acacia pycnantha]|nr:hypothetical protein K1719_024385 [Acacia pycnantha]